MKCPLCNAEMYEEDNMFMCPNWDDVKSCQKDLIKFYFTGRHLSDDFEHYYEMIDYLNRIDNCIGKPLCGIKICKNFNSYVSHFDFDRNKDYYISGLICKFCEEDYDVSENGFNHPDTYFN